MLYPESSNLLLQNFFQNKIVFVDTIGKPRARTKKSSGLIKGGVLLAKPACTDHVHYCCLTSPSWETMTWLTPGEDELHLLKPPIFFLILKSAAEICKKPSCVIPHLHECVGFCSTCCSQEGFTEEMENAACWTYRERIFQLAPLSKSTKNFHQFQNNEPTSQQQGPYKYWKQNLVCIKFEDVEGLVGKE